MVFLLHTRLQQPAHHLHPLGDNKPEDLGRWRRDWRRLCVGIRIQAIPGDDSEKQIGDAVDNRLAADDAFIRVFLPIGRNDLDRR